MGFWKKKETAPAFVQLRQPDQHPFGLLNNCVPMRGGETQLCRAVREAVPIVDAAIWKLIRLVGGVTVGLMFTSMYVGYSAVGSSSFGGVQGRYLQPILPLLFLILSPNGVKNEMNKTGWHLCFCLGNLTILMLACGQLVLTNLMR